MSDIPKTDRPRWAVAYLQSLGWSRVAACAIVGQAIWESGGPKDGDISTWDIVTTARGDGGSAHGGWQWRGDRYIGTKGLLSYTIKNHPEKSSADLGVQLSFVDWELHNTERRTGSLLNAALDIEEASAAFITYLRPAKATHPELTIWQDPKGGHGYANRLRLAKALYESS